MSTIETITKVCSKCKEEKPLEHFHKKVNDKSGVQSACKICHQALTAVISKSEKARYSQKKHYRKNRERLLAYSKKYIKDNPELYKRAYFIKNKEVVMNLSNSYMVSLLTSKFKIKRSLITQELIELKRIQVKTLRLCQQLKN